MEPGTLFMSCCSTCELVRHYKKQTNMHCTNQWTIHGRQSNYYLSTRERSFRLMTPKANNEDKNDVPSWARPDSDEPPPWARDETSSPSSRNNDNVPFFVYLLASAVTAIAAVSLAALCVLFLAPFIGSVFEYANQKPVFGVINSDSIFYAPLLGFFAFTGIPTSAFLWFKSVQVANKEAEEQDRRDGYL